MKVIFLDIDGVLNSDEYIDRAKNTQGIERHIDIDKVKLLKKAIDVLKPGKEMVYSTCSILQEENEDIVNQVLNNNLEIVPIKIEGIGRGDSK